MEDEGGVKSSHPSADLEGLYGQTKCQIVREKEDTLDLSIISDS